eukprot:5886158-Pyramimonas_sp.AAC.1
MEGQVGQVAAEQALEVAFGLIGPQLIRDRQGGGRAVAIASRNRFLSLSHAIQNLGPVRGPQLGRWPNRWRRRQRRRPPKGQGSKVEQLGAEAKAHRPLRVQRRAFHNADAANTFAQTARDD